MIFNFLKPESSFMQSKIVDSLNRKFFDKFGIQISRYRHKLSMGKKIKRDLLEYSPFSQNNYALFFIYVHRIYNLILDKKGAIVECGVGEGNFMLMSQYLAKYYKQSRKYVGYDTFEGLPKASKEDGEYAISREGSICYSQEYVEKKNIQNSGLLKKKNFHIDTDWKEDIIFVKGNVNKTLENYNYGEIALLNLDMDLYEGYKFALEKLYEHVIDGGVIMFDEYKPKLYKDTLIKFPGPTIAINEFFGDRVNDFKYDEITGRFYYIKKNKNL